MLKDLREIKVWIDYVEYPEAHARLTAEAKLMHVGGGSHFPVSEGSAARVIMPLSAAEEVYRIAAEMRRIDVAVLDGGVVTIARDLFIVEQLQDTADGAITNIDLTHGRPLQIMKLEIWEGLLKLPRKKSKVFGR